MRPLRDQEEGSGKKNAGRATIQGNLKRRIEGRSKERRVGDSGEYF